MQIKKKKILTLLANHLIVYFFLFFYFISFCNSDVSFPIMVPGTMCERLEFVKVEIDDKAVDIDKTIGPQLCATIISDIYNYLRASEVSHFYPTLEKMFYYFIFSVLFPSSISFKWLSIWYKFFCDFEILIWYL